MTAAWPLLVAEGVAAADAAKEKPFRYKEWEGTRSKETKHSVGENLRILRLVALEGGRGRLRRCCGREALRDKEGEETKCQETKHFVGENVIIVRLSALDGGRDRSHRCCGREALRDKEGRGRDVMRRNILWVRIKEL